MTMDSAATPSLAPRDLYRPEDLARAVVDLRRQRGWTQATLAAWLGVTRPTIARLETSGAVNISTAIRALTLLGAVPTVHLKTQRLVSDERTYE
jgi:DNA-binding XRE family transcriptional regulator